MINKYHGTHIDVDADKPDWGKKWGVVSKYKHGCWCYICTLRWLEEQRKKGIKR